MASDARLSSLVSIPLALAGSLAILSVTHSFADTPQPLAPGDIAITGFSGATLMAGGISPGTDPADKTVIDLNGISLRVLPVPSLAGSPSGQVINPAAKFEAKAKDIGQVFGVAIDEGTEGGAPPSLFAAASSYFGLQIVAEKPDAEGQPQRLKAGSPGARFMPGQFGSLLGAGPGTIFKLDGTSGAPSVFANTDANGVANSGAGLGGLAVDAKSRSIFASDLDTGLIHRFSADIGGASSSQFDHGSTGRTAAGRPSVSDDGTRLDLASARFKPDDPTTWGMTAEARRTGALAIREGRLFYSVAEGPEIWSVGLNADGTFGTDVRVETAIKLAKPGSSVTAITFDGQGRMIVATRGTQRSPYDYSKLTDPESGRVLLYERGSGGVLWSAEPKEFAIGAGEGHASASGGAAVGHGFAADGSIDFARCGTTLIATGDLLSQPLSDEAVAHGLQLNATDLVRPANVPPAQSTFIDFDGRLGNKDARGHVGAVAVYQRCGGAAGPAVAEGPPVEGTGGPPIEGGFPPVAGDGPGVAEGGAPVVEDEAPPVADGPAVAEDETFVDPNAPNIAVNKTQECALAGPDKLECSYNITATNTGAQPFTFSNASFEDFFSVVPETLEVPGGATRTAAGFTSTSAGGTIAPGQASPGLPLKATFKVPPGGLVVENCASVSFVDSGGQGGAAAAQNSTAGLSVTPLGGPTCVDNLDGRTQDCTFGVIFANAGTSPANAAFRLETDIQPVAGKGFRTIDGSKVENKAGAISVKGPPVEPGGSGPALVAVEGTFPKGATPRIANVTVDLEKATQPLSAAERARFAAAARPRPEAVLKGPVAANDSPGCEKLPDGNKNCQFIIDTRVIEPAGTGFDTEFKSTEIELSSSVPAISAQAFRTGQFLDSTLGADKKTINFNTDTATGIVRVSAIFPGDAPDPIATVSVKSEGTPVRITQGNEGNAAAAASPVPNSLPSMSSEDANPNNNTSCIKFDTNKPDDQGTPTNAPTEPPPVVEEASAPAPGEVTPPGKVTVTKTGVPSCKNSGGCDFTIQIKNEGPDPVAGPIKLEERVKVNGRFFGTTTLVAAQPAPWTCGPIAEVMSCTSPEAIGAGETKELKLTFAPSSAKELAKTIENCVTAVGLAPPVCATIPVEADPPPPPPVLVISKLKQGGGTHCPVHGPCVFNISIRNKGDTDFVGPLSVKEFLPGAVFIPSGGGAPVETKAQSMRIIAGSSPGWDCQKRSSNEMDCSQAGVKLAKGEFLLLLIEVVPGDSWKNAQTNELENCASLSYSGGPADQPSSEKRSCKTVKLDPFDVAVVKTGGQSCQPGRECKFNLDIFNPGNIPHDDPVTVTDKLTGLGAAPIVSLTAAPGADPFPCNPLPTQAPFTCTGHMRLDVGERNKYEVVIRVPEGTPPTGSFTNCASVAGSKGASDEASCHPIKIEPAAPTAACPGSWTGTYPDCKPPQLTGGTNGTQQLQPAVAACTNGMRLNTAGKCECAAPAVWNGRLCLTPAALPPPAVACPAGWRGSYPNCYPAQQTGGTNSTTSPSPPQGSPNSKPTGGVTRTRQTYSSPSKSKPTGSTSQIFKDCYGRQIPVWQKCKAPNVAAPSPSPCPPGTYRDGRVCRKVAAQSPPKQTGGTNSSNNSVGNSKPNFKRETFRLPDTPPSRARAVGKAKPCPPGTHREADGKCFANVN